MEISHIFPIYIRVPISYELLEDIVIFSQPMGIPNPGTYWHNAGNSKFEFESCSVKYKQNFELENVYQL